MRANEWLDRYGSLLGVVAPTADEVESLLELAGVAAHASERMAAPITCWLVAQADLSLADALALARRLAEEMGSEVPEP
jgi:hypothetical protein